MLVMPLTEKNLSFVKSLFREGPNLSPVLIPIDSAAAIAGSKGPYESFDIPKGTLRGAPPVPEEDVTTLRVGYYLVANRHLNSGLVTDLTKKVMAARRDLVSEQPILSRARGTRSRSRRLPVGASGCCGLLQRHPGTLHG